MNEANDLFKMILSILKKNKTPMRIREITEELLERGWKTTSREPEKTISSKITSYVKDDGEFIERIALGSYKYKGKVCFNKKSSKCKIEKISKGNKTKCSIKMKDWESNKENVLIERKIKIENRFKIHNLENNVNSTKLFQCIIEYIINSFMNMGCVYLFENNILTINFDKSVRISNKNYAVNNFYPYKNIDFNKFEDYIIKIRDMRYFIFGVFIDGYIGFIIDQSPSRLYILYNENFYSSPIDPKDFFKGLEIKEYNDLIYIHGNKPLF